MYVLLNRQAAMHDNLYTTSINALAGRALVPQGRCSVSCRLPHTPNSAKQGPNQPYTCTGTECPMDDDESPGKTSSVDVPGHTHAGSMLVDLVRSQTMESDHICVINPRIGSRAVLNHRRWLPPRLQHGPDSVRDEECQYGNARVWASHVKSFSKASTCVDQVECFTEIPAIEKFPASARQPLARW
ncbi:hypothetical protein CONLIGDRAFT_254384 [Coniochaeta ligniaria NRRL 30616]|uniref:Uncharacterized protein n=1 Tax=Coniochaeta ligniaria NRRL 30616 TaxID=1408157 RepID=A0A1J7JWH8_9PEZI|nr:hypothetical protein CONLIGDRAFT_254384 [Coniochaeta ligniaria NRRL 30616]